MTICPFTPGGKQCQCQPDDGVECVTFTDLRAENERLTAERDAACRAYDSKNRSGCCCTLDPKTDAVLVPCAAHSAWADAALKDAERLRAALAELVALKDLKERIDAGPPKCATDAEYFVEYPKWCDLRGEYERRKPSAWNAARMALTPKDKA